MRWLFHNLLLLPLWHGGPSFQVLRAAVEELSNVFTVQAGACIDEVTAHSLERINVDLFICVDVVVTLRFKDVVLDKLSGEADVLVAEQRKLMTWSHDNLAAPLG